MVHVNPTCTHCCIMLVSGNRWVCRRCINFQLCDRCYDSECNWDGRLRHPINQRDKHTLYPVENTGVPEDTRDTVLTERNHYQCAVCHLDNESGQSWQCETCSEYDVCHACYQKDRGGDHPHNLTNQQSKEHSEQENERQEMLDLLIHASQCCSPSCLYPNCRKIKGLFRHGRDCTVRAYGGCALCKKMWYLIQLHARACKESTCLVPRCRDLKEHWGRRQQNSDPDEGLQ